MTRAKHGPLPATKERPLPLSVGHTHGVEVSSGSFMIIEPYLITFPACKIYQGLGAGELEEIVYYDDEPIK